MPNSSSLQFSPALLSVTAPSNASCAEADSRPAKPSERRKERWSERTRRPAANTPKGAAGGRSDVARNEPLSAGRKTSDRPANHHRASDGAMPAGALLSNRRQPHSAPTSRQRDNRSEAEMDRSDSDVPRRGERSESKRSFAGQPGGRRFARQRCSARTSARCQIIEKLCFLKVYGLI